MPQITALMTTYNSAAHVRETIDSILKQTFSDFEFLILDDGSTDNTVELIKSYNDQRIRLIEKKENEGVGKCLSEALLLVDTPYIAKIDSDDISLPERFEKQLEYLRQNQDIALVKSYISYFADTEKVESSARYDFIKNTKERETNAVNTQAKINETLRRWLCIPHTTYFGRTEAINQVGYPDSRTYEDYYLFYNMVQRGYKLGCVRLPLVRMRISELSTTATTIPETIDQGLSTIVDFKWHAIEPLAKKQELYLYGSGQLARSLARVLYRRGVVVNGFLDKQRTESLQLDSCLIDVFSIQSWFPDKSKAAVIVAAQPVRAEFCQLLEQNGWQELTDFMVIA